MPNRLARETSPYLLQHAHNPVDWFAWGEEAFAKSRQENKPIFLSVGYATCHWCHVMERESFEDPAIASYLNAHFVPIKVDREELPDVDHLYMSALQALTGSGGWPMNMFLTPDLRPFWGGTYFPPEPRPNYPSFQQVLMAIGDAWQTQPAEIEQNAAGLAGALQGALRSRQGDIPVDIHAQAVEALLKTFDPNYGGFGSAPKFPQSPILLYLLSQSFLGNPAARNMLSLTLQRMAEGGLYDQVGGGFHRYAVDQVWRVPHFEKMLYDNAQLARVYAGAYKLSGEPMHHRIACQTLDYLTREMQGQQGGFYSAQDADSEGKEGKFYVWQQAELETILGADAEAAIKLFGVNQHGNWEGHNILERRYPEEAMAQALGIHTEELQAWVDGLRARLYAQRKKRIPPITDDKVLADWNGLALRAFAEAGRLLGEEKYIEAARHNARFVLGTMLKDGLLRHSWRGRLRMEAYLSDQANYGLGLLELFQATGEPEWIEAARGLAEGIVVRFTDPAGGFRDSQNTQLPLVSKDTYDGPHPSGSAAAAEFLFRMAALFEQPEWHRLALSAVEAQAQSLSRSPTAFTGLLLAHQVGIQGTELAVLGDWDRSQYWPLTTLAISTSASIPALQNRTAGLAYLCRHGACRLPAKTTEALGEEIRAIYSESPAR
jgi:hypothetical protein